MKCIEFFFGIEGEACEAAIGAIGFDDCGEFQEWFLQYHFIGLVSFAISVNRFNGETMGRWCIATVNPANMPILRSIEYHAFFGVFSAFDGDISCGGSIAGLSFASFNGAGDNGHIDHPVFYVVEAIESGSCMGEVVGGVAVAAMFVASWAMNADHVGTGVFGAILDFDGAG